MLSKILSKKDCEKCRLCCSFDSYDLWETPIISKHLATKILQEFVPQQKFVHKGEDFIFKMEKEENEDLYFCPMLDKSKGCILGDDKPFDCEIWPFRVMNYSGRLVLTLSPVCPVLYKKPVDEIMEVAKEISKPIFRYAQENSGVVKKYIDGYPIFATEDDF